MNSSHCVVFLFFLAAASLSSLSEATITCDRVASDLMPCVGYITGPTGAKPPPACCDGAKALVAEATTPEDRKAACECLKQAAAIFQFNYQNAHDLPNYCNIQLPFEITPDLDCNKYVYIIINYNGSFIYSSFWFVSLISFNLYVSSACRIGHYGRAI